MTANGNSRRAWLLTDIETGRCDRFEPFSVEGASVVLQALVSELGVPIIEGPEVNVSAAEYNRWKRECTKRRN